MTLYAFISIWARFTYLHKQLIIHFDVYHIKLEPKIVKNRLKIAALFVHNPPSVAPHRFIIIRQFI